MTGYPRNACYSANRGSGAPLLAAGKPDLAVLAGLARYQTVTLNLTPWYSADGESRADVPLLLRRLNPSISILGYCLAAWWYLPPGFVPQSSDMSFAASWHRAIRGTGGFGEASGSGWRVRWENPATEAALTSLLCGAAASRLFDSLFFDFLSARDGVGSDAMERMVHAVRQSGGPGFLVLGNGWSADALDTDGSFREGFPDLLGHNFEHVRSWRAGRPHRSHDWLQAGTGYTSLDTADAQRAARFALGTACLFDCLCSFGPDRDLSVAPYYGTWWLPEYDGGGLGAGWLGESIGKPWVWTPLLWRRDFGGGIVLVNASGVEAPTPELPRGHYAIGGPEVGTVTVPAMDAVFLVRAR